jgi:hypothetical protein
MALRDATILGGMPWRRKLAGPLVSSTGDQSEAKSFQTIKVIAGDHPIRKWPSRSLATASRRE